MEAPRGIKQKATLPQRAQRVRHA